MAYHNELFLILVFTIFGIAASIQLFYYIYFYMAVNLYKPRLSDGTSKPVSVIICARNESENLKNFLPSVLEQDYPDYEVIVVNDCSEDNSYNVLGEYLIRYPHLKVSTINKDPKFTHNKKFAQFIGIKAAKNDILLFTDADCKPESDQWLAMMSSHFEKDISFVLGYGGYRREKGLLNKYIRYDSIAIAMQYLGMALKGIPYMGVGRNLAYRKTTFFENNGFGAHNHIISGDDDLFVNSNATETNTMVEFRTGAHTRSVPCSGFIQWAKQKRRHLTTAPYYKLRDKLLLIFEPLSRVLFYTALIILLSFTYLWPLVIGIFGLRLIIQTAVFATVQKKLNEPGLIGFSIFFDIFSPLLTFTISLGNIRSKSDKNRWR